MERPIIFSGAMVRALLAGTKSQTRRPVVRLTDFGKVTEFQPSTTPGYDWTFRDKAMLWNDVRHDRALACCPYGKVGDVLWVRENWKGEYVGIDDVQCSYYADQAQRRYARRLRPPGWLLPKQAGRGRVIPSIYLPRFMARFKLTLLDVRLELLRAISETDARAEGVAFDPTIDPLDSDAVGAVPLAESARDSYRALWDCLNPDDPWDTNPPVWALTFTIERFPLEPGVTEHGA